VFVYKLIARRIRAWLQAAGEWAGRLGLQAERHPYTGWGVHVREVLCCSSTGDDAVEALYTTRYRRPRADDGSQLDLFFDGSETVLLNDLREALRARRPDAAKSQLLRLLERSPNHPQRSTAELLCDALAQLDAGVRVPDPAAELAAIVSHLAPAARELLGAQGRDLLAPFWRRLGEELSGCPFDPGDERLHGSWVFAQCLDWEAVRASILATPGWTGQPRLVERLAEACFRLGEREAGIALWCRLCWDFPAQAESVLGASDLPDVAVMQAWEMFTGLAEPDADAAWFPAWLLLAEPGLTHHLATDAAPDTPGPGRAFRQLHRLQCPDRAAEEEIALRAGLSAESPRLLAAYLATRSGAGTSPFGR
jgi:hypothetical protein